MLVVLAGVRGGFMYKELEVHLATVHEANNAQLEESVKK